MILALFLFAFSTSGINIVYGNTDVCLQDPVTSYDLHCRGNIPIIYYNRITRACECFYYQGCNGTENLFTNLNQCTQTCGVSDRRQVDKNPCETLKRNSPPITGDSQSSAPSNTFSGVCRMPVAVGDGYDYIPRFYYNEAKKMCDCFIYFGSAGNLNRFRTMKSCMSTCNVKSDTQIVTEACKRDFQGTKILLDLQNDPSFQRKAVSPTKTQVSVCDQELKPGTCRAYLPSFYYSKSTGMCECFVYSGCQGNRNRFKNLYDCTSECGVHLYNQAVTSKCKEIFNGTSTLDNMLRDSRLKGHGDPHSHATSTFPGHRPFQTFPLLPKPPLFIRDK